MPEAKKASTPKKASTAAEVVQALRASGYDPSAFLDDDGQVRTSLGSPSAPSELGADVLKTLGLVGKSFPIFLP